MTIGELARAAGCTPETIRYYERSGVLPAPARAQGGYRRYRGSDVRRLVFVRRARDLGFTLREVQELLAIAGDPTRPCAQVDALAREHLGRIEAKLAELEGLRREVARVIGGCGGGVSVGESRILGALGAAVEA